MPISWEIRKTLEPSSRSSRGSIDCSESKLDRECSPFALPTRDISWKQGYQKVVDFLPTGSMQKSVPHFLTLSPHSICGFTSPWAGWHNGDCFADSFVGRGFRGCGKNRQFGNWNERCTSKTTCADQTKSKAKYLATFHWKIEFPANPLRRIRPMVD